MILLIFPSIDNNIRDYLKEEQDRQKQCVAEALHYEARGESPEGISLVLSVIQNRLHSGRYGRTYCDVIKQYKQFSYRNDYDKDVELPVKEGYTAKSQASYAFIVLLAEKASKGKFKSKLPKEVMWYHTKQVNPKWNRNMKLFVVEGNHKFYSLKGKSNARNR
jgi:spore germination cell wall hydrolase CwlJ-like protein